MPCSFFFSPPELIELILLIFIFLYIYIIFFSFVLPILCVTVLKGTYDAFSLIDILSYLWTHI